MNDTDKNRYSIIWDCLRMACIQPRIPILMETMVVFSEVSMYHVQTNAFSSLYLYLSLSLHIYMGFAPLSCIFNFLNHQSLGNRHQWDRIVRRFHVLGTLNVEPSLILCKLEMTTSCMDVAGQAVAVIKAYFLSH